MTVLLCGTESVRQLDASELGERFLDVVIAENMDEHLEREIAMMVLRRVTTQVKYRSNGKADTADSPQKVLVKQLSGGYVNYLRTNQDRILSAVAEPDEATMHNIVRYAEFVAFMRTRPSKSQDESTQREMCVRLTAQLGRLAMCLAAVLNKTEVDGEVMRRVRKVALDTARGRTFKYCTYLYAQGKEGAFPKAVAVRTGDPDAKVKDTLRFLGMIQVCRAFTPKSQPGSPPRWPLTKRLEALYHDVMGPAHDDDED